MGFLTNVARPLYKDVARGSRGSRGSRNTLDYLEQDPRFQEVSERFLSSVGNRSGNVFGYLRDSDYNLYSGFSRAMKSKEWTPQQQQDYRYLRRRFDNADTGSLRQYLAATKDIGLDIATDPTLILATLLTPVTGGTSLAARQALATGATKGLKNIAASQTKRAAAVTGFEGATWLGLDNHFRQETELNTKIRKAYSAPELVGSAALGGLMGGLLGAVGQKAGIYYSKKANKFSDDAYLDEAGSQALYNIRKAKDKALSVTIGKPTAILNTIAKYSPVADELRQLFRYDAAKTFTSKTTKRLDWSYGERVDHLRGNYKVKYQKIIDPLYREGEMNPLYQEAIVARMRGAELNNVVRDLKLTNQEGKVVGKISDDLRGFFDDIYKDALDANVITQKQFDQRVEKYFPRSWNREIIEKNQLEFKELLVNRGVVEADQVNDIVRGMLNKRNELFSSHTNLITQRRIFKNLNDNDFTKFLHNDLHAVSTKYFFEAARVIERKKAFGLVDKVPVSVVRIKKTRKEKIKEIKAKRKYGQREATPEQVEKTIKSEDMLNIHRKTTEEEFIERWLKPIQDEMIEKRGRSLTQGESNNILKLYKSVTGQVDYYDSTIVQGFYDATKIAQAMAHLPLATVSSLTEIIIPLTRSRPKGAFKSLQDSIMDYHKHLTEDARTMFRDKHGMKEPEMLREMHKVFLAVDEAVADRIESLAGEGLQNETVKKVGRGFFKLNLLTDWTRFVQLTSFNIGKDIIRTNLKHINKAVKGGKSLDKMSRGKLGRYKEELFELGIDIEKGLKWTNTGSKIDDPFYDDILKGAGRFTNEVILNPSREKALKPIIQSSPKVDILFQFLGYPTAFSNTVLKNAARAVVRDPFTNAPRVLVGGIMMTNLAMALNYWRSTEAQRKLVKSNQQAIIEGIQRVGALGPMEHAYRFSESLQYSKSPVASAALLGGPIWEDAIGAVAFKRGLAEILTRNLPGYGARAMLEKVTGAKLDNPVLRGAKKFDRAVLEAIGVRQPPKTGLEIGTSIRYAEGGRVGFAEGYEVSVPFAKEEPEERVNPYTGEPYTAIYKKPRVGLVAGGVSKLIQKFFAKTPVKRATDKKWTNLSITDESDKVVGLVKNIPASPGNSYIRAKTPEFRQYLIDNQIGRQSKTVDSQFYFDTSSQKAINKLLNKPFNK